MKLQIFTFYIQDTGMAKSGCNDLSLIRLTGPLQMGWKLVWDLAISSKMRARLDEFQKKEGLLNGPVVN